ncbi:hypothetical protein [Paraclostridium sordellii]|uniref:hypothetical protein n=1 Tax=Paraclostridium sordellii TaxID=1505 RepID=UPI0005E5B209|nr:hypothetical protein [Paeniclostridium sordellii]CEN26266.1 Uncharacterised protein [[Clostridium] sordellii] [Paeniclostridium sordellii]
MDLKIISVNKHFKNGKYRIVAKNLFSGSVKYYSLEECKLNNITPGDLIEVEPMNEQIHLAFNGKKVVIEKVKFKDRKIIISTKDYFEQLANN